MRRRVIVIVAAAFGLVALVAGYWVAQHRHDPATDSAFIDFTLFDTHGTERALSAWRGRTIVLNFWATWCAPCREEIPLLIDIQTRYAARGVQVVGVAIDRPDAVVAYAAQLGMNYPVLLADARTFDLLTAYGDQAGALPFTVVVDPAGGISRRKLGAFRAAELEHTILDAINDPAR